MKDQYHLGKHIPHTSFYRNNKADFIQYQNRVWDTEKYLKFYVQIFNILSVYFPVWLPPTSAS